jgi:hypothetical protein
MCAWDEVKTKTFSMNLLPDGRRTVLVKLGRIRKNLSIESP